MLLSKDCFPRIYLVSHRYIRLKEVHVKRTELPKNDNVKYWRYLRTKYSFPLHHRIMGVASCDAEPAFSGLYE